MLSNCKQICQNAFENKSGILNMTKIVQITTYNNALTNIITALKHMDFCNKRSCFDQIIFHTKCQNHFVHYEL